MKPKSHKVFKTDIAKEVGVHASVVDEFVSFYYSRVRSTLSNLEHSKVFIDGLGTFSIRKVKLEKAIKKNKSYLGNLEKNTYGLPMTIGAVRGAWERALKRIGMGNCGLGPHSLRHMYGQYCASVLKLPLEVTSMVMHHSSPLSTKVYYHLKSEEVRHAITSAVKGNAGTDIMDFLIMPDTGRPALPSSWEVR